MSWFERANCAGKPTGKFFPSHSWPSSEPAKVICSSCDVKRECLEYALRYRIEHGIWGAKTPEERALILRRRGRAA
jgi:WhiB family redox-sensing transcriptional regulator